MTRLKVQLIENWKDFWRFTSVQLAALLAVLDVAYEYLPVLQTYMPAYWIQFAAVLIVVARVIRQSNLRSTP